MAIISKDEADKFEQLVRRQEEIKKELSELRKKSVLSAEETNKIKSLESEFKENNNWFTDTSK